MKPAESFVGQPIRSLQTMLRTIAKAEGVSYSLIPDGIYGPETGRAVGLFQKRHGLPVTGVTDQATWEQISAVHAPASIAVEPAQVLRVILNPNEVIRKNQQHHTVPLAQVMLICLSDAYGSVPAPSVTGILDDPTADSLAAFQQLTAIPMTGELDKATWKHLALHYPLAVLATKG